MAPLDNKTNIETRAAAVENDAQNEVLLSLYISNLHASGPIYWWI